MSKGTLIGSWKGDYKLTVIAEPMSPRADSSPEACEKAAAEYVVWVQTEHTHARDTIAQLLSMRAQKPPKWRWW